MGKFKNRQGTCVLNVRLKTCAVFALFFVSCASYATTGSTYTPVQNSVFTPPTVTVTPICVFNFEDTYYNANTATPPGTGSIDENGGTNTWPGDFGAIVQLQFNNYNNSYTPSQYTVGYGSPTQYTPNVPCTGHYEVSYSLEIRNNWGIINGGLMSMSTWATTTDPLSPNAYGCPVSYIDYSGQPHSTNSSNIASVHACATFSQQVQCAWTNNYNASQEGYLESNQQAQGWPIFMYTAIWPFTYNGNSGTGSSLPFPGFCVYGAPCTEISYNIAMDYTYYCTSKTFNFKNVVYLHAGAQISAPAVASQIPSLIFNTGWDTVALSGDFAVVGGKFKAVYIGP